jgi:hypothetical protein
MSDNTLYCAFCKKNQRQVATLIAGPAHRGEGLFVCDECVDMLAGIVAEKRGAATRDIASELYQALERLGAPPELLGVVGTWGDGFTDRDVLEHLSRFNRTGSIFDSIDKRADD